MRCEVRLRDSTDVRRFSLYAVETPIEENPVTASHVQTVVDKLLSIAKESGPQAHYSLCLSEANSLLLPRTSVRWSPRSDVTFDGRHVYQGHLVCPLDDTKIGELVLATPVQGVGEDNAPAFLADLRTGAIETA